MESVLIAEDDAAFAKILQKVLQDAGFKKIDVATNGAAAFKAYQTWKPDVVVLDIQMPVMDGLETLQTIRRFDREAKVIMMTAEVTKEFVVKAARLGAMTFLRKDLKPKEMAERFCEILDIEPQPAKPPPAPEPEPAKKDEPETPAEAKEEAPEAPAEATRAETPEKEEAVVES